MKMMLMMILWWWRWWFWLWWWWWWWFWWWPSFELACIFNECKSSLDSSRDWKIWVLEPDFIDNGFDIFKYKKDKCFETSLKDNCQYEILFLEQNGGQGGLGRNQNRETSKHAIFWQAHTWWMVLWECGDWHDSDDELTCWEHADRLMMVMVMLNDGDGDDGDGDHGDDGEDYVGRPEWRWRGRQVRWGQHTVLHNILVMIMIHGGNLGDDEVIMWWRFW